MPTYTTLIDAASLVALPATQTRIFDCRFDLLDEDAGEARFQQGRVPGAAYLHLGRDLSGPVVAGRTGRHPLPNREIFQDLLRSHGVAADKQLVAYDDSGGMFAARLWWMARWAGHARAAVLDGGYPAWLAFDALGMGQAAAREHSAGQTGAAATPLADCSTMPPRQVAMADVRKHAEAGTWTLLDARAEDRFRGENEIIDAKAGHIPNALNAPFQGNLDADGRFLSRQALRARFESLLGAQGGRPVVCYCGSGVSAAHNVLAMVHAGLPAPALYAGSWSEWISRAENPMEKGESASA